jgi:hypothetical protein
MVSGLASLMPILADVDDLYGYLIGEEFRAWLSGVFSSLFSQVFSTAISSGIGLLFTLPGTLLGFIVDFVLDMQGNGA